MLYITNSEFERVVSRARNRMLAKKFYDYKNVKYIEGHINNDQYIIRGEVVVNDTSYFPYIEVNKDSKIVYHSCDCIFSDEYTACAHIGAMILALQNNPPKSFPFKLYLENEEDRKNIIERKKREQELARRKVMERPSLELAQLVKDQMSESFEINDPTPVKISIIYENHYTSTIRFKIGQRKSYYIKNISDFLEDMRNHTRKKYGKDFTWTHNYDDLDEESQKIYEFIRDHYHLNDVYYYGNNNIALDHRNLDQFVSLLKSMSSYDDLYKIITPTLEIDVFKDEYDYTLKLNNEFDYMLFTNSNGYILRSNYIEVYQFDDLGIGIKLLDSFEDNRNKLFIPINKMNDFYQYILNPIKDYIKYNNNLLDSFNVIEDNIEIYGDIDEDAVAYFSLMACYGNKKVNFLEDLDTPHSPKLDLIKNFLEKYNPDMDNQYFYFDTHYEETMDFLNIGIPYLSKQVDVFVSESLKKIGNKSQFNFKVGIGVSNDLLSIDFESIDIPKEELANVLKSYQKKKKYHKLKNGEMIYIESDQLEEVSQMMEKYHINANDMVDGHIDMNLNRAFALELSAQDMKYMEVNREKSFENIIDRLKNYKASSFELTDDYNRILRDYQKEGYQWLSTMNDLKFGGILADDMGLGKTLQMIAMLENHKEHFSIVVCPSSLVLNWLDEFEKFSKTMTAVAIMGSKQDRLTLIKNAKKYDTIVTSYDYLRRDIDAYKDIMFDFIILDEAQYIKNQKTKNAISVKKLQGKQKFALTGTPIENSLAELWSIFDFLNKDYLYNYHYFKKQYESPIVKDKDIEKQNELKKLISPFVLRRTKKEVLKELPDKVEKTIPIEFSNDEKKLYYAHLADANKILQTIDPSSGRIQILAMLTKLRQICCEPRMAFDDIKNKSSKLVSCLDIIENYKENNKKIIVFSSFTSALHLIADELDDLNIKYHMLTGATAKHKRKMYVDSFQSDDSTVFLISLKAGGTGLNLTSAEGVIHFDPWWNMSAQSQATDRAHRIGQKNTVFVYKLIMSESIEEKIQDLQNKKKDLADTFVEGNEGSITSMTNEEIMDLFKV